MDTTNHTVPSAIRIEAHGTDPAQAMDDLPRLYAGIDWSTGPTRAGAYRYRYAATGDTAMSLRTSQMLSLIHI